MARSLSAAFQKLLSLRLVDKRRLHLLPEQSQLRRLLSHFDVDCVFDVGANTGVVKSFSITADGNIDIDFLRGTQNPNVKGIEIVRA